MLFSEIKPKLLETLTPLYGESEASAIARIVQEDVFGKVERALEAAEIRQFEQIRQRLAAGEPVQYILGLADFFGLKFLVNPSVLIPRQETEELVDWILNDLKNGENQCPTLLDIGLGSGCIGITLKKKFPALNLYGLEKSPEALRVARENAQMLLKDEAAGQNLSEGDILDPQVQQQFNQLDVIVSNPPYIPHHEKHLVPRHVQAFEPALALFVTDEDPLLFYRVITEFAFRKLTPGGALYFECNEFNASEVLQLMQQIGFRQLELRKDICGAERMTKGVK